jgi:HSP20 family protein
MILAFSACPALQRSEVQLEVGKDGMLTISTSPPRPAKVEGQKVLRKERVAGGVVRGFLLPEDADTASIQAGLKDGVLRVVLKKKPLEKEHVRRVPISKL